MPSKTTKGDQVITRAILEQIILTVRVTAPTAKVVVTTHDHLPSFAISGPGAEAALIRAGEVMYNRGYKWLTTTSDFAWLHSHVLGQKP